MDEKQLRLLLEGLTEGKITVDQTLEQLKNLPFEDIGFARIDHHRSLRCGFPEVIFCPGKTTEQIVEIVKRLAKAGSNVLATRSDEETFNAVNKIFPELYFFIVDILPKTLFFSLNK